MEEAYFGSSYIAWALLGHCLGIAWASLGHRLGIAWASLGHRLGIASILPARVLPFPGASFDTLKSRLLSLPFQRANTLSRNRFNAQNLEG